MHRTYSIEAVLVWCDVMTQSTTVGIEGRSDQQAKECGQPVRVEKCKEAFSSKALKSNGLLSAGF